MHSVVERILVQTLFASFKISDHLQEVHASCRRKAGMIPFHQCCPPCCWRLSVGPALSRVIKGYYRYLKRSHSYRSHSLNPLRFLIHILERIKSQSVEEFTFRRDAIFLVGTKGGRSIAGGSAIPMYLPRTQENLAGSSQCDGSSCHNVNVVVSHICLLQPTHSDFLQKISVSTGSFFVNVCPVFSFY